MSQMWLKVNRLNVLLDNVLKPSVHTLDLMMTHVLLDNIFKPRVHTVDLMMKHVLLDNILKPSVHTVDLMMTHVAPCDGFRERLGETHLESAK